MAALDLLRAFSALFGLRPLQTRLKSAKSAGIRQSNARWPIGTERRQRAK
jgi:hypothetical protein